MEPKYKCVFYVLNEVLPIESMVITARNTLVARQNARAIAVNCFKSSVKFSLKRISDEEFNAWNNEQELSFVQNLLNLKDLFKR